MAVTRQQIYVQQSQTHHAYAADGYRGEYIWTPLGPDADRWVLTDLRDFNPTYANTLKLRQIARQVACRSKAGSLYSAYDQATAFTEPDGAWTKWHYNGFEYLQAADKDLVLKIPANTLAVWVTCLPLAGAGTAVITASSGTVVKASISTVDTTGDFGVNASLVSPRWVKLVTYSTATPDANQTVTLDCTGTVRVIGFLCVKDGAAGPDEGVFDPDSFEDVWEPTDPSAGPIGLSSANVTYSGTPGKAFYWGESLHWYAAQDITVTSLVETRLKDGATWNPTAGTLEGAIATSFVRKITGTVKVQATGQTGENVGTHDCTYTFTADGLFISQKIQWNANAATIALKQSSGFCGMWELPSSWQLGRVPTSSQNWTRIVGPWGSGTGIDTDYCTDIGSSVEMKKGDLVCRLTAGSNSPGGLARVRGLDIGDFPKMYVDWLDYTTSRADPFVPVAIANGDVTWAWQWRQVLTANQAGEKPKANPWLFMN